MNVPEEEGHPATDSDLFSPSGAPTARLQPFRVDKESMAVMDKFLELFPCDDDSIYKGLHMDN